MPTRRALSTAALALAALCAAAGARAQESGDLGLRGGATTADAANAGAADEPLRRLDDRALAGGDYGTADAPLAGGGYGGEPQPDRRATEPPASAIDVGDPFARRPALSTGANALRPRRSIPADDPYAPTGVRAGSFTLRPTLESAVGYDSNPDRDPVGGKSSKFYRLRGDIEATSDWSRHELRAQATGQIRRYVDLDAPGYEPEVNATADGRIDVTERTQIVTQLRASITTSRPGDPDTPTDIDGDEISRSYGATLGVAQRFNRLSLRLDGLADRYLYDDSKLLDGSTLDNSDRVYNAYQLRLRAAYEVSPALAPFAEVAVDTRDYDRRFGDDIVGDGADASRRRLGSDGWALRGGARFEATRLVTGELAVGYGRQTPKDDRLKPVDGLLFDGSVAWAPTALTTVRLNARSSIDETVTEDSGGILRRSVGVAVEHALRRNLLVTGRVDYESADYKGADRTDDTLVLGLEAEYRLNRTLALIGSFQHERRYSNLPGEDYDASIIEFGLRVRQ
ncbi:outer membrane beta-barrel protein [Methylopila henanensis]|uniref:Outer membrane beta-barrel protein n=1 Tax=Methylopila henanensis TaxID=873516 RepID=A0ABW4K6I4_9HYPH